MSNKTKIVTVLVFPSSRKEKFKEMTQNNFEARVKEPAVNNLANKRVRFLLSQHYGVGLRDVHLLTGHKSSKKRFEIML